MPLAQRAPRVRVASESVLYMYVLVSAGFSSAALSSRGSRRLVVVVGAAVGVRDFEFCRPPLLVWSPPSLSGLVGAGRSMFVWLARDGDLDAHLVRPIPRFPAPRPSRLPPTRAPRLPRAALFSAGPFCIPEYRLFVPAIHQAPIRADMRRGYLLCPNHIPPLQHRPRHRLSSTQRLAHIMK